MRNIKKLIDWLSNVLLVLGGVAMALMMINVVVDIVTRNVFRLAVPATLELVSYYYMVAVAFLPLAFVQRYRGHVMIELFTMWLPARVNAFIDGTVYLLGAVALAIFTYAAFGKAVYMTGIGEMQFGIIDVVVWPGRWFVPIGVGAMALQLALQTVAEYVFALRGVMLPGHRDLESLDHMEQI
jgi:TRAP-type C4-dicarboxylate transport system permease small subunit